MRHEENRKPGKKNQEGEMRKKKPTGKRNIKQAR